jgi:hypothetical protein
MNIDWLKKARPSSKYDKFTIVANKVLAFSKADIEKMGYKVIDSRIIDNN